MFLKKFTFSVISKQKYIRNILDTNVNLET